MKRLLGKGVFDTPKPIGLIKYCCEQALENDDLVLDFFAGSGTTAHAVLELNQEDHGNRKFILVQLPELTGRDGYPTITDICRERVRRVIQKLNDLKTDELPLHGTQDRGFRVFKLAESNFHTWNADVPTGDVQSLQHQLDLHVHHIRENRTPEDIL